MNTKRLYRKKLKGLIKRCSLYKWLNKNTESWNPEAILDAKEVEQILSTGYIEERCSEIRKINHFYYQPSVDNLTGKFLFPLKDGNYFKVGYECKCH